MQTTDPNLGPGRYTLITKSNKKATIRFGLKDDPVPDNAFGKNLERHHHVDLESAYTRMVLTPEFSNHRNQFLQHLEIDFEFAPRQWQ